MTTRALLTIFSFLGLFSFACFADDKIKMSDLKISESTGLEIKPYPVHSAPWLDTNRRPASLEPPRIVDESRVDTYISVTCYGETGKPFIPGDNRYSNCMENASFGEDPSIFSPRERKDLQMGIIIK